MTKERISRILELKEILLSFQNSFKLVNAAVVCAILESNSGLEPSSVMRVTGRERAHVPTALSFHISIFPLCSHI